MSCQAHLSEVLNGGPRAFPCEVVSLEQGSGTLVALVSCPEEKAGWPAGRRKPQAERSRERDCSSGSPQMPNRPSCGKVSLLPRLIGGALFSCL